MPTRSISFRTPAGLRPALGIALAALPVGNVLAAEVTLPPISVGAGIRSSFTHTSPDVGDDINDFELNSARIYISGKVTENISLMFNTEYNPNGATPESVRVIDAAAQFSFSDQFNIWAGRFLPPSDRANLYGPYYANHWGVYRDGVQDGYPFETEGRNDGVMYWGQFGIAKVSAGVFDVQGLSKGSSDVLYAGRVQLDFWDPEGGYYLNSTYYGEKDLLSVGIAGQAQGEDNTAWSADVLLERGIGMGGAFTVEAEYARYSRLGGYPSIVPYDTNDGAYVLGAYLFPALSGPGRFEVLGKYAHARFRGPFPEETQKTSEINLNYLIKQFNARFMIFFQDSRFDLARDSWKAGAGLQLQM
jgi:hypothetical protein